MEDRVPEFRCILAESRKHRVHESFPVPLPTSVAQLVGRILGGNRHHVLARGSQVGIRQGGNFNIEVRVRRIVAVFRAVVGALDVHHVWSDLDRALKGARVLVTRQRRELRQGSQGQMNLRRRAPILNVSNIAYHGEIEQTRIEQLGKCRARIGA